MNKMTRHEALVVQLAGSLAQTAQATYSARAQKMIKSACFENSVKMLASPVAKQRIMERMPNL